MWKLTGALALALVAGLAGPAEAAPPATVSTSASPPTIVTVGDSYIGGQGARWAGNTNRSPGTIDALGPTAYFDNAGGTAEQTPRCHRARTAEAHIGGGVSSVNLACSGAGLASSWSGLTFTPGLDFYDDGRGHRGQAALLRDLAATRDVRLVVVSIGGNDLGFSDIVTACAANFALSTATLPNYCRDDAKLLARIAPPAMATLRTTIVSALRNVRQAMREGGHPDGTYDVLVQTYPSVLPSGSQFRYSQRGITRFLVGGCPFWNADANWAGATVLPLLNRSIVKAAAASRLARVHVLDVSAALVGRRLCEKTVGLLEEKGLSTWKARGAVDSTEWVTRIRLNVAGTPYKVAESVHPNYWGSQALQACLRLAWNRGSVRGGRCTIAGPGLSSGDPRMRLS